MMLSRSLVWGLVRSSLSKSFLLSILFWNVCGIGNVETESHLCFLIFYNEVNLVALVEPKISGPNADRVCRRLGFDGCFRQEEVGMSGGIWVLWQSTIFSLCILQSTPNFVHINVKEKNGKEWVLTVVYRNPNESYCRGFWDDVATSTQSITGP